MQSKMALDFEAPYQETKEESGLTVQQWMCQRDKKRNRRPSTEELCEVLAYVLDKGETWPYEGTVEAPKIGESG